jgi:hypothetical protein
MKTIELLSFSQESASEALRQIPEINDIHYAQGNLFWLGAVDSGDKQRVQRFSELCEQGRFGETGGYADISQGCVYAILARRADGNGYRLFLLEMGPSPHAPQRCLLTKVFDNITVTEKQGPVKDTDVGASLSLKDIVKNVFR